jgi:hypothetical protein
MGLFVTLSITLLSAMCRYAECRFLCYAECRGAIHTGYLCWYNCVFCVQKGSNKTLL